MEVNIIKSEVEKEVKPITSSLIFIPSEIWMPCHVRLVLYYFIYMLFSYVYVYICQQVIHMQYHIYNLFNFWVWKSISLSYKSKKKVKDKTTCQSYQWLSIRKLVVWIFIMLMSSSYYKSKNMSSQITLHVKSNKILYMYTIYRLIGNQMELWIVPNHSE